MKLKNLTNFIIKELINIYDDLVFVAIKNGIHNSNGYLFTI